MMLASGSVRKGLQTGLLRYFSVLDAASSSHDESNMNKGTDLEAMRRIALNRFSVKEYSSEPLPDGLLEELLPIALRAPSSYNTQPFKVVVVRDEQKRKEMSKAFLGANPKKICTAPVTVVFAADLEPLHGIPRVLELMRATPQPPPEQYLSSIPLAVGLISGGGGAVGQQLGGVTAAVAGAGVGLLQQFKAMPHVHAPEAWAFKQTAFAASQLLLTAAAAGVGSTPIEGFDNMRLRNVLGIPDRYSVPVVVTLGYPAKRPSFASPRLPTKETIFEGAFGSPMQNVADPQ